MEVYRSYSADFSWEYIHNFNSENFKNFIDFILFLYNTLLPNATEILLYPIFISITSRVQRHLILFWNLFVELLYLWTNRILCRQPDRDSNLVRTKVYLNCSGSVFVLGTRTSSSAADNTTLLLIPRLGSYLATTHVSHMANKLKCLEKYLYQPNYYS